MLNLRNKLNTMKFNCIMKLNNTTFINALTPLLPAQPPCRNLRLAWAGILLRGL